MRRIVILLVLGLFLTGAITGCQDRAEMAAKQKAAFEVKKTEIQAEIDVVLQAWLDSMLKDLPEDVKKYPKVKSPLDKWRRDSFNFDWRRPLDAAVVKARYMAVAEEFEAIPKFFDTMEKYWKGEVMFKDYMEAYNELKRTSKDPLANLLADFDHTFVHVEAFYGAQDMEGDDRAIYFFRHWQVAFNFPRESKESVGEYVARLCDAKLKDYCPPIPFEVLHFALEKPYLTEVKKIVDAYLTAHPDCQLNKVFPPFFADVAVRMDGWKDYVESPVLPSLKSRFPFTSQLLFTVDADSVEYEDKDYLQFKAGWAAPDAAWKAFAKQLVPEVEKLATERGPENMEIVVVKMDQAAPIGIAARIVESLKDLSPRYVQFGGRHRGESIAKLTKFGELQFREVPALPGKYQFDQVGALECRFLGQSVDDQEFASKIKTVVWLGKSGMKAGTLADGKVVEVSDIDAAAAAKALLAAESLLLVDESVPYQSFTAALEPVFVDCDDEVCKYPKQNKPKVGVSVCLVK